MTKITAILYNDLNDEYVSIRDNLRDLTKFKMQGMLPIDIVETSQLSDTLDSVAKHSDWAVVITAGNWLEGQYLIQETVDYAIKEDTPLICHIMERGGYYNFHPQWFAINLSAWRAAGSPRFEDSHGGEILVRDTERSSENIHHDYTPLWLKARSNTQYTVNINYSFFGTNVITALVDAGYTIKNVPDSIRNRKRYPYPDTHKNEIADIIANPKKELPADSSLGYFKQALDRLTDQLDIGFYVLNTETITVSNLVNNTQFDTFIGVCGGIKPANLSGQSNFADNTQVHLFDISQAALDWQKFLLENWDGDFNNFESVFAEFKTLYPNYIPMYHSHRSIDDNINWYLESGNLTREEFKSRWQRYRAYNFNFVKLNLLDEGAAEQVMLMLSKSQSGAYLWVSNLFDMDYLMFYKTKEGAKKLERNFLDALKTLNTRHIIYESCNYISVVDSSAAR